MRLHYKILLSMPRTRVNSFADKLELMDYKMKARQEHNFTDQLNLHSSKTPSAALVKMIEITYRIFRN